MDGKAFKLLSVEVLMVSLRNLDLVHFISMVFLDLLGFDAA